MLLILKASTFWDVGMANTFVVSYTMFTFERYLIRSWCVYFNH